MDPPRGDRFAALDHDLGGRTTDFMFDLAAASGVDKDAKVLDVGCGRGNYAVRLAEKFRCAVVGVDPLEHLLRQGRAEVRRKRLQQRIIFRRGTMDNIPADAEAFDFIWARDMLNLVQNLRAGFAECSRVLKPHGRMIISATLATPFLEPRETLALCRPMGTSPETLDRHLVERAMAHAGLHVQLSASTSDARSQYFEAFSGNEPRILMRLAALTLNRRAFERALGKRDYAHLRALYLWQIYSLIGKMTNHIYMLEKRRSGRPARRAGKDH